MKTLKPYIYIFSDTRKVGPFAYGELWFPFKPFYVGMSRVKTRRKLNRERNRYVRRRIEVIRKQGFEVNVYCFPVRTIHLATLLEAKVINVIGRKNRGEGPLLNLIDGGYGDKRAIISDETRARMSEAKLGKKLSEEHRRNISRALMCHKISIATREKLRKAKMGQFHTAESIRKMRASHANRSPESIEKMKEALRGRKLSTSHRENISKSNMGHKVSKRVRKKIGKGNAVAQIGNSNRATVPYIVTCPDESMELVVNLSEWCREKNFPLVTFTKSLENGREAITKGQCKGYSIEKAA